MSNRLKWVFVVLCILASLLAIAFAWQARKPLPEKIFAAQGVEFVGVGHIADGGSTVLHFRLPYSQYMALLVRNRVKGFGNPDFQEIWLSSNGRFNRHIDVQPGSELERKLVALLHRAKINTNVTDQFSPTPTAETLKWAIECIQDRKVEPTTAKGTNRS